MKPIVAVVGRPNVGKSTLVNRLAQTSDAIVHESRGVTRDRSYHTADWNGREFTIVDTGGIEPLKSDDVFATSIRDQALAAAEEAAVILFVVDGRTGVTEEDESVARMLKRCDKPVFLLVNKLDNPDRENDSIWEFYSLGIGEPTPVARQRNMPSPLLVAANTRSPACLVMGRLSPVSIASLTLDSPSITSPSTGRLSPGRTMKISPGTSSAASSSTSCPSRSTRAVFGCRRRRLSIAAVVRALARASSSLPSNTSVITAADASKYTGSSCIPPRVTIRLKK